VGRGSLAIGRKLTGPAACKHRIKRTWRFCTNPGIVVSEAMRGPVRRLLKRRQAKPGKYRREPTPLLVALWNLRSVPVRAPLGTVGQGSQFDERLYVGLFLPCPRLL
jgi:hypothetical protein